MSENLASNPILELTPQPVPALEPPPQPAVVEKDRAAERRKAIPEPCVRGLLGDRVDRHETIG